MKQDVGLRKVNHLFRINLKKYMERKRIYLCLAHMSEDGMEQKYVKEAFDTN